MIRVGLIKKVAFEVEMRESYLSSWTKTVLGSGNTKVCKVCLISSGNNGKSVLGALSERENSMRYKRKMERPNYV